jgi:putative holliday junction resolvase
MRYIALDLGDKRTGVAVGDAITRLVSPVGILQTPVAQADGEALLSAITQAIDEHLGKPARPGWKGGAGEIVVGLPMNMDGTEGPRAKLVRAFAQRIVERTGRVVHFQDERLTSSAADWAMARTGWTHKQKKERRDALAAAAILEDFLASLPSASDPDQDR